MRPFFVYIDMRQDYEKFFHRLSDGEPPQGLYHAVLARIAYEKRRAARLQFACFGAVALLSFIALVPAFGYAAQEFSQSSFKQYLSLFFSDSAIAIGYWKEFSLSLADSLPLFGITLVLSMLFALVSSLKLALNRAKIVFPSTHLLT